MSGPRKTLLAISEGGHSVLFVVLLVAAAILLPLLSRWGRR